MSLITSTKNGVPRPGPEGANFYVVPMSGPDLKKIARAITKVDYLRDAKGAIIFNQLGAAVPQFDMDEDRIVAEALKRCPRIDHVKEGQLDGDGNIVEETLFIDPMATEKDLPAGTIIDPQLIRGILELLVKVEREVPIAPTADDKPADDKPAAAELADGETPKPKTRPAAVTQLIAEWLLGESADLGLKHLKEAQKNS